VDEDRGEWLLPEPEGEDVEQGVTYELTPAVIEEVFRVTGNGQPLALASVSLGIPEGQLQLWLDEGEAGGSDQCVSLWQRYCKAQEIVKAQLRDDLMKQSKKGITPASINRLEALERAPKRSGPYSNADRYLAMRRWAVLRDCAKVGREIGVAGSTVNSWLRRDREAWERYAAQTSQAALETDAEEDARQALIFRRRKRDLAESEIERLLRELANTRPTTYAEIIRALKTLVEIANEGHGEAGSTVGVRGEVTVVREQDVTDEDLLRFAEKAREEASGRGES